MLDTNIERFRQRLENIIEELDATTHHVSTREMVRVLQTEFDIYFPKEVWNPDKIYGLIEKYCYGDQKKCPICASTLLQRVSRAGRPFLGCPKYPTCGGSRSINGLPSINESLKDFVSKARQKDLAELEKKRSNRFRNLDL